MRWKSASPDRYELLKAFAKENRQFMTEAERTLWMRLRGNVLGHKFLRQHIIGDYIVDFLCRDAQVIIEVDGGYHKERQFLYKSPHTDFLILNKSLPMQGDLEGHLEIRNQVEEDRIRQEWLESVGYKVIRFTNEQILHNIDCALAVIKTTIDERYKRGQ
jgi:very-short-patch-repair endonuclease